MYSKIINPAKEGQNAYNNKGSSMRLGNYLEKELDLQETPDAKIFFNDKGEFTKNEMVSLLDSNVRGLRESDDKFYSLVVSPSQDELEHIENDREKLKIFAELCMENYAQNFNLTNKKGEQKNITSSELVWFATIEQSRTFKGTDPEVKEGTKKQGDLKEGLQTHIHITVSARDASMQTTLNPLTSNKNRFSMISWAKLNKASFDKSFGFESPKQNYTNEKREVWNKVLGVERQLSRFEEKYGLPFEDTLKLRNIAIQREYSKDFRDKLKELGKELRQNRGKNGLSETQWETMLATQKEDRNSSLGNTIIQNYSKGVAFFESAEAFGATDEKDNAIFKGSRLKKKLQQRNQQNKTNDISR
jgi:Family of unknown function (DUF5712)